MKTLVNICRIIVGVLFIFSGLIKANDPLGLAYKMEEFFEIWNTSLTEGSFFLKSILIGTFNFFHKHSLFLSVVMIAFEIIAGAALLLGWRIKLFSWLLLLMIVFFTFLTAYAFLAKNPDGAPKFSNCGCFGDCLPIPPLASFLKDIFLTILIVFLFVKRRLITPLFSSRATTLLMLLVTIASFGLQWYTLNYLPILDCLPYKKGKNITEQMKVPANAVLPEYETILQYEKNGKKLEFAATAYPADFDSTYKFIKMDTRVVKAGKNNVPPIVSFKLEGISKSDSTDAILAQPFALLIYSRDNETVASGWTNDIAKLYTTAREKGIPVYVITAQLNDAMRSFSDPRFAGIQFFTCDPTAIKTASRTNPSIYLLKEGTILDKWSYHMANKSTRKVTSLVVPPVPSKPEPLKDSAPPPIDNNKIK
jgi:uncharacterized membrane protein YphA (DoxX/SURF4 family)